MDELSYLFQPGRIGTMEVKNRLVMPPMVTWSAPEALVTDALVAFYRERAQGGVGLITVQATCVLPEGRPKGWLGIWDDSFLPGLARLAQAIKEAGARAAIQIHHAGVASPQPMGPSAVPNLRVGTVPRELGREEIALIVEAFVAAAERSRQACFDAVELHGAGSYLINNFFSPMANQRRDEYGGSVENRTRFAQEILAGIRRRLGPDFPLGIRIGPSDFAPGGSSPDEVLHRASLLAAAGADFLDISPSGHGSFNLSYLHPPGTIAHLAAAIKVAVPVPVFVAGKINDPVFADGVIAQGQADFVALGRALLADPEWPHKAQQGRSEAIRRCIYCTMCTSGGGRDQSKYPSVACSINPSLAATWRGEDYHTLTPAATPRRILVVGGGLAGMHAATVLAQRGHTVSLHEASDRLGGQWLIAVQQDYKKDSDFGRLLEQTIAELHASGAQVHLNQRVSRELVQQEAPEVVIVATGASPAVPEMAGVDRSEVVQANDVLEGKAEVGERAVVVGGGYVGMEVALHLAERGRRVYLLTRSKLGRRIGPALRRTLIDRLIEAGVYLFPESPVVEVVAGGVKHVWDGEYRYLEADTVVVATGVEAERGLADELVGEGVEVHSIGDVVEPRDAFSAFHEAAALARHL